STELIPYLNPDKYDCWCVATTLHHLESGRQKASCSNVVAQGTVSVLIPETGKIELASVLELDPHGTSDTFAMLEAPSDGLSVWRGDFLFVRPEGKTNGSPVVTRVPRVGEVE
ncbi:hypothetical protein C8F04DRAFT_930556, partial [Mycena alexandri]